MPWAENAQGDVLTKLALTRNSKRCSEMIEKLPCKTIPTRDIAVTEVTPNWMKEILRYYNQRIDQSQVQASGQSEDDTVGNSSGVRRELAEGIGSLPGWRKGVHRKKTETRWKIVGGS
ncbi:hypothetical protein GW17_00033803 [Ensete ventricosum]|nr:hypothetical protein GW17_00033803 [Ensete ventricosum]